MIKSEWHKNLASVTVLSTCVLSGLVQADSYDDFKNKLDIDSTGAYIVEGDIPIRSEQALQDYYHNVTSSGSGFGDLIVGTVQGVDGTWDSSQRKNISYCVSTDFGDDYEAVVNDMAEAASAWQANGINVGFYHNQLEDSNCDSSNSNIVFDVNPETGSVSFLARAFFPFDNRANRNILISNDGLNSNDISLVGILRHELGHTLGFRHEHTRPDANASNCFEDNNWRVLTDYDSNSVMHYPQCNGTGGWALDLTDFDRQGVRDLYGIYDDFEGGMSLQNTGEFSWIRDSNGTPSSNTGPDEGAGNSSYYAYLETSSGYAYAQGNTASIETEEFDVENAKLTFNYHMFGSNIGQLYVDVLQGGQWISNIITISGQQHGASNSEWKSKSVDLSSYSGNIKVRLRAVAAGSYRGDIAIDNILIESAKEGLGCNSSETPIGTTIEKIYNDDGSYRFTVNVGEAFNIQPGQQGDFWVDYVYPPGECPLGVDCDSERLGHYKEEIECSDDGRLGKTARGTFWAYPSCYKSGVGYFDCP